MQSTIRQINPEMLRITNNLRLNTDKEPKRTGKVSAIMREILLVQHDCSVLVKSANKLVFGGNRKLYLLLR